MPESTCLHIQDHESAPIRVVDIPWISVRVGRAAFCEVRLPADDLADEACRLYRRGRSWHLVPAAGPRSKILLAGQQVDASCPLPFDVPFRVGGYCLTLRQDRAVDPDWGMYPGSVPEKPRKSAPKFARGGFTGDHARRADLIVEPHTSAESPFKPEWRTEEMPAGPTPTTGHQAGANLKDRWESRWRAAGVELKARTQGPAPRFEPRPPDAQAGFESVPLRPTRVPRATLAAPAHPTEGLRPARYPDAPAKVDPVVRPVGVDATASLIEPADFASPLPEVVVDVPEAPGIEGTGELAALEPLIVARPAEGAPAVAPLPPVPQRQHEANDESWYEMPAQAENPWVAADDPVVERPVRPTRSTRSRAGKPALTADSDRPRTANRGRRSRDSKSEDTPRPQAAGEPRPVGHETLERAPDVITPAWPSAKHILASHRNGPNSRRSETSAGRSRPDTGLTVPREPGHWRLPRWLAGPPAVLLVLTLGLTGGLLSWRWAKDAYAIAIVTGRLMSPDGGAIRDPLPDAVVPPGGTWTRSTAQHLAHWAMYLSKGEPGRETASPEVIELLNRALEISPLNPTARLARAELEPPVQGAPVAQQSLGLSRDAISLSWSARRLLAAGHKKDAMALFEQALKVANHPEAGRAMVPRFSEDPGAPRYLLPGEERVQEVLREMISKGDWTFAEWAATLPRSPAAFLAAARLLKKEGHGDADTLVEQILDNGRPLEAAQISPALCIAARAEAFAMKSRWRESEEQYRLAIELVDDDTLKRSWWFNLADIELRLDDETQRQTALRAALADASDEISRRATEIQRGNLGRPTATVPNPRAN
jgi:hypothetical protein